MARFLEYCHLLPSLPISNLVPFSHPYYLQKDIKKMQISFADIAENPSVVPYFFPK